MERKRASDELWARSAWGANLAVIVSIAIVLGAAWVANDGAGAPPLVLAGAFGGGLVLVWVLSSRRAIVALREDGLRVGWLGLPTTFVPWSEVTKVRQRVREGNYQNGVQFVARTAYVDCGGRTYSVSNRFVGRQRFEEAWDILRQHTTKEAFEWKPLYIHTPSSASQMVTVLWITGPASLALAVVNVRAAMTPPGGSTLWTHAGLWIAITLGQGIALWALRGRGSRAGKT